MARWRVTLEVAGKDVVRVVDAPTRAAAEQERRVVEAGGRVTAVEKVLPNLAWREPWGWYLVATVAGRRYCESLRTADRAEAERRRDVKLRAIEGARWADLDATRTRRESPTVAEVLRVFEAAAARRGAPDRATVVEHVRSLRRVVAAGLELAGGVEAAGAQRADVLDGDLARRFGGAKLAGPWEDMEEESRARRSVAAALAHARAPLAREWWQEYREAGLHVPEEAWTEFRERYVTAAPVVQWQRPAEEEERRIHVAAGALREAAPELWVAWLLSRYLGLRARESAAVRWGWFVERPDGGAVLAVIRREAEGFRPKRSEGEVPVHPSVWRELTRIRGTAAGAEPVLAGSGNARYQVVVRGLADWMRGHGWERRHTAHELRALFGDDVLREFGPRARDAWLRHGGGSVGDRSYSDRRVAGAGIAGRWEVNDGVCRT